MFDVVANMCIMYAWSGDEIAPEIIPSSGSKIYFIDAMNFTSDGGTNSLNFSTNYCQ